MKIFQIYYNDKTKSILDKSFLPLNNSKPQHKDWFEFEIMHKYINNNQLEENTWYGFLSTRFVEKTNIKPENLIKLLNNNNSFDLCLCTANLKALSVYQNIFIQGEMKHHGLMDAINFFVKNKNINIDIKNLISHSQNSTFANFVIAKKNYWLKWLELSNQMLDLYRDSPEFKILMNKSTHHRNKKNYKIKVFIQERLHSIAIQLNNFKIFSITNDKSNNNFHLNGIINTLDYLKIKFDITKNNNYINIYNHLLKEVLINS